MLVVAAKVFDDVIFGTTTTWFSPAQLNDALGAAEHFAIQASVTGLTGTAPKLTVTLQHSADNQYWVSYSPNVINNTSISNDTTYQGAANSVMASHFVRVQITLAGTNPQCRLKLYLSGHDLSHSGSPPQGGEY